MKKKITVILFASLLGLISIANLLQPDTVFSQTENRFLQTFPEITWERFKSGKLATDFDLYTNDQFILRNDWVSLKTNTEILIGKQDNGRVYFGDHQWLFSIEDRFSEEQYHKNIGFINNFIAKVPDVDVHFMLIPSKSTIMHQYLPKYAPVQNEHNLYTRFQNDINEGSYTDLFNALKKYNEEPIYFRTDHHWTSLGAYYAYQTYLGQEPHLSNFKEEHLSDEFFGTDYRKANYKKIKPDEFTIFTNDTLNRLGFHVPPLEDTYSIFNESFLSKTDKYAYYQGGNHGLMTMKGLSDNGQSLLIIKDSFANSMLHYLAQDYESITVVDLRYFNGKIDTVLQDTEFNEILFTYNIRTITQDVNLSKLR